MKGIELGLPQPPLAPPEIDRHVVKSARCETTIEMPQSRNDHPDDRNFDVWAGLVEDEEIEPMTLDELYASQHLLASIEAREFRKPRRPAQRQRIGCVQVGLIGRKALDPIDCQKLRVFVDSCG
jgi:hypothetical protein